MPVFTRKELHDYGTCANRRGHNPEKAARSLVINQRGYRVETMLAILLLSILLSMHLHAQNQTDCSFALDAASYSPQTKTFPCPTYEGRRLDFCYRFSVRDTCGPEAAIQFCKSQGYKTVDRDGFVKD